MKKEKKLFYFYIFIKVAIYFLCYPTYKDTHNITYLYIYIFYDLILKFALASFKLDMVKSIKTAYCAIFKSPQLANFYAAVLPCTLGV